MENSSSEKQQFLKRPRNVVLLLLVLTVLAGTAWRVFIYRDNALVLKATYEMDFAKLQELADNGYNVSYTVPERQISRIFETISDWINKLVVFNQQRVPYLDDNSNIYNVLSKSSGYGKLPWKEKREQQRELLRTVMRINQKRSLGKDFINETLVFACRTGDLEIVSELIELGANVNCRSDNTPPTRLPPVFIAFNNDDISLLRFLLKHEANVNITGIGGKTLLHYSSEKDRTDAIQLLIENGAKVNGKDDKGRTPVFFSCHFDNLEALKLLIKNKADTHIRLPDDTSLDKYADDHYAEDISAHLKEYRKQQAK